MAVKELDCRPVGQIRVASFSRLPVRTVRFGLSLGTRAQPVYYLVCMYLPGQFACFGTEKLLQLTSQGTAQRRDHCPHPESTLLFASSPRESGLGSHRSTNSAKRRRAVAKGQLVCVRDGGLRAGAPPPPAPGGLGSATGEAYLVTQGVDICDSPW